MRDYDVSVIEYADDHLRRLRESSVFDTADVRVNDFFEADLGVDAVSAATQNFQFWLPADADPDLAYEFAERSIEHATEIRDFAQFLQAFDSSYAVSGLMADVPVHPGVAQYYKDHGLWSEELSLPE